ncbi:hypothetical protein [Micromonospora sp. WMMD1082]|uniref:hypothetical protein n=1 Tax=Micromonospora sp. WMMD1082 TaxID=3016104 RepID=UPI0024168296|nr:hypothetical protein [Micromonospora sp. WMMD1082]MDG4796909.1 hypothetical protein [Micromonospora sp. WMMD1082]
MGREDIVGLIVVLVTPNNHERVSIEVDASAIRAEVGTNRHDIKVLVENFIDSLERIKPIKLLVPSPFPILGALSLRERTYNRVQLVLDRRISSFQARQQRRHNLLVSIVSGIVGAVLGAVATIAATVLGKS